MCWGLCCETCAGTESSVGIEQAFAQGAPGVSWGIGRRLCPWRCPRNRDKALSETAHGSSNLRPLVWKPSLSSVECNPFDIRDAFGGGFPGFLCRSLLTKSKLCSSAAQNCLFSGALLHETGSKSHAGLLKKYGSFRENTAWLICWYICLQPKPQTACQNACAWDTYGIAPVCPKLSVRWRSNCMSLNNLFLISFAVLKRSCYLLMCSLVYCDVTFSYCFPTQSACLAGKDPALWRMSQVISSWGWKLPVQRWNSPSIMRSN